MSAEPRHLGPAVVVGLARGVAAAVPPGTFLSLVLLWFDPPHPPWGAFVVLVFAVGVGAALGVSDACADARPGSSVFWRIAGSCIAPLAGWLPAVSFLLAGEGRTLLGTLPEWRNDLLAGVVPCLFVGSLLGIFLDRAVARVRGSTPTRTRLARSGVACAGVGGLLLAPPFYEGRLGLWLLLLAGLVVGPLWLGLELGERAAKVVEERLA